MSEIELLLMEKLAAKATPADTDTMIVAEGNVLKKSTISQLVTFLKEKLGINALNTKMNDYVTTKNFTQKENGAVLLDDAGRKLILTEWQNRKKETITHPYLQEKVEWGMVPYVQAMLLARFLRGDLDGYPAFLWK